MATATRGATHGGASFSRALVRSHRPRSNHRRPPRRRRRPASRGTRRPPSARGPVLLPATREGRRATRRRTDDAPRPRRSTPEGPSDATSRGRGGQTAGRHGRRRRPQQRGKPPALGPSRAGPRSKGGGGTRRGRASQLRRQHTVGPPRSTPRREQALRRAQRGRGRGNSDGGGGGRRGGGRLVGTNKEDDRGKRRRRSRTVCDRGDGDQGGGGIIRREGIGGESILRGITRATTITKRTERPPTTRPPTPSVLSRWASSFSSPASSRPLRPTAVVRHGGGQGRGRSTPGTGRPARIPFGGCWSPRSCAAAMEALIAWEE